MVLVGKFRRSSESAVEQAARAGSTSGRPDRGAGHFLVLVATIVVAGSMAVGYAWAQRQHEYPTLFDSWENAYGVFDCQTESWLEPFDSLHNPNGIRSRADGVIYIEPNDESATGENAQLGLFLDTVGATLDDDTLTLPDGSVISEQGTFCRGEEAVLQVMRWDAPLLDETVTEIRTDDLAASRFVGDQQAFVIALAPLGSTIPPPPSISSLTPAIESSPR